MKVALGVSGGIACYKSAEIVRRLQDRGVDVTVLMTRGATEFVTPLTFRALSGNKVYSDVFEAPEEWDLLHTSLSAQADLVLVCPATLNLIGKMAGGICDDLLTCILFATKAPVVLAPAMNTAMYEHPITQQNIAKLKKIGVEFVGPVRGELACRQIGMGHIEEPARIVAEAKRRLQRTKGKR